jgi:hypothetical protein
MYPAITKEQFYSKYDKEKYKFIPNSYRELDDSILIYRDEITREKLLIFQLVDIGKNSVPEHRKNLYILPVEDQFRLKEEIESNSNKNKRVSAQLLKKFINPYEEDFITILNRKSIDTTNVAIELGFDPFITRAFEYLVDATNNKERQVINLVEAKKYIDKKLNIIKRSHI